MNYILITGANGYIGSHIASHLAREGHKITAVMRHADTSGRLDHPNIQNTILTDITQGLDGLCKNIDIVIHAAGRAHQRGKRGESQASLFKRDNVDVTLKIAQSAQKSGVKRMINLSSIGATILENDLAKHIKLLEHYWQSHPYRTSKLVAERELSALSKKTQGFDVVNLRLPMVYGKDAPGNFKTLCCVIQKRIPLPFDSIHNTRAFVSVDAVCSFVSRCLNHPQAAGVWALCDSNELSTPDFIRALAKAGGYPKPILFPFPVGLMRILGRITGLHQTVESLVDSLHIDRTRLQETFGWSVSKTTQESLCDCFKEHGYSRIE